MPDYRHIYDDILRREPHYQLAEHSPGFLICLRAMDQLRWLHGRALDFGCGAGFVVSLLARKPFRFQCWGVDVSDEAVALARQRTADIPSMANDQRILRIENGRLPFADHFFSLVTCFDVLEHLDEADIDTPLNEMDRVLRPGGLWFGSVSCRASGATDATGKNLHRTVRGIDWWLARIAPDRAEYESHQQQLTMWKRRRRRGSP